MASEVSTPPLFHTALRAVEYVFSIPSIGVAPEKKALLYRLKNTTDNVYLTLWKERQPKADGEEILIDFYADLDGVCTTPPPDIKFPNLVVTTNEIAKKITVEYGERTINVENCEPPQDTLDGTTTEVTVINGIAKVYEVTFPDTPEYYVLSNRPRQYTINRGSYDFLYILGTMEITVDYYAANVGIDTVTHNTTGNLTPVTIIPIGFQIANTAVEYIIVSSPQMITDDNPSGQMYFIYGDLCSCDNGEVRDIYFQNGKGGIDIISFDCVDSKQMNVAKQYRTQRYNKHISDPRKTGQKRAVKNNSAPTINFKRDFENISYLDTRWLDEFLSSSNIWLRDRLDDGSEALIRMNIQDGGYSTYGESVRLTAALQYSEEIIIPVY
jgi:hypothetical protein